MSDNSNTGVTREDVIWCFDRLLGRVVVENDIQHFVQTEPNFRSLVTTLLSSAEYERRFSRAPQVFADGFIYDDAITSQKLALQTLRMIKPKKVEYFEKARIGNAGDGGYIMLDDFNGIEAAYSLGINDDVSWDLNIARLGIDIFQYDHTIDKLPEENSRFHWFRTGISGTKRDEFDTLPNLPG